MIIHRDLLDTIRPFIGKDVIKVITGIRRCGKSVLLGQLKEMIREEYDADGQCIYLDLDDLSNARLLSAESLFAELERQLGLHPGHRSYIFLDEIQEVPGWDKVVNSLRMRPGADVYITGSNSRLLSGELSSLLTGRYVEFTLAPFSYSEFLEASGRSPDDRAFSDYLHFGGMPFLSSIGYQEDACRLYLRDLYNSILLKDVVSRKGIRDVALLERIVRYAMTETGHVFSAGSIAAFLKKERCITAPSTVLNYLTACEEAFLFSRVEREDLIGKRILSVDEKYYVMDCGLRNANISSDLGRDIDQLLEVVVYREMRRRGYEITLGRVKNKEVDLVCRRGKERLYIQVTYLMATEETRAREFGALFSVPDQYAKMVLSMDRLDLSQGGIAHRYLPDFLLAAKP